jgi:phosphatidylglycerophosphate synthase
VNFDAILPVAMSSAWVLVLDPPTPGGDPGRRIGGLSLAERRVLDAQAAGAAGGVCPRELAPLLGDPRIQVPLLDAVPAGARVIRVRSSQLVHRGLFKAIAERDSASASPPAVRDLTQERFPFAEAWGFDPIDVTNDALAVEAERLLFRSLRKKQDGWTSRYLNRYISLSLTRLLVRTKLKPNQVSVVILGIGLLGAWFASRGDYLSVVVGAFLFQTQSVLDGCDGEMSRVTHQGSRTGEWLDTIGDDLTNYGFFGGLGIGLYRTTDLDLYLAAGIVTVVCGLVVSTLEYRYLVKIGSGDLLKYPLSQGQGTGRLALIQPLFKRDTFVFLTLIAAVFGLAGPVLCIFALGAIGILASVIATEIRLARNAAAGGAGG